MVVFENPIAIGCDHAGFKIKEYVKTKLEEDGYVLVDYGTFSESSVDYPDIIHPLAKDVNERKVHSGIIICGSGNGVAMTANKYPNIRAAVCWNEEITRLSRQHNDANLIAIPARFVTPDQALVFSRIFFQTDFEKGRHERRVNKIPVIM
jgi:ribose 5-phosphate isomerase B